MGQSQSVDERLDGEPSQPVRSVDGSNVSGTAEARETNKAAPAEAPEGVSPMEALIAEAEAYSSGETESLEAKAQKALECPCIANLRSGACGSQFTEAFLCYMKSTEVEKGSDCVHPFVALQNCIKENPDAFSKDILDEEEIEDADKEIKGLRTPSWARE